MPRITILPSHDDTAARAVRKCQALALLRLTAGSGNSRQLCFIEKWFPGERLTIGLVKMSIL